MSRPVVIGALTGLAAAAGLWAAALDALSTLDTLRAAAASDAAAIAGADALPAAAFRVSAGGAAAAQKSVARRIRRGAAAGGLLVERLAAAAPVAPGIARLSVGMSGSEKAVLTLADAIEREGTGIRWRRWRIEPVSPGTLRLSGEAAIAWR
jgi:hypothetical protein